MKNKFLSLSIASLGLSFGLAAAAGEPPAAPAAPASEATSGSAADAAFENFQKLSKEQPPEGLARENYARWYESHSIELAHAAEIFMEKYPQDPRRWAAANAITMISHNLEGRAKARAAAGAKLAAEALAATDISDEDWQQAKATQIGNLMDDAQAAGKDSDLSAVRTALDELNARLPASPLASVYEFQYVKILEERDPKLARAQLEALAVGKNPKVAKKAAGKLYVAQLREKPVDLKFVALDGKKVDLAKMRGKVVLVDFWATWCGPCVAELPNLKAVYDKYHKQGFEVVGVSVDSKGDREKLEKFIRDKKLAWPQFLDEKNERNEVAENFGITLVPTPLLFNKKGILVNESARGEKLDEMVKGLLEG